MVEWKAPKDENAKLTSNSQIPDSRSLGRMRRRFIAIVLIAVAFWELFNFLVFQHSLAEVVLNLSWSAVLGLSLIQIGFRVVLHLYEKVLQNARLLQETQQKLAEASTLTEVSQAVSSRLAQEDLMPYLAESLVHLLDSTDCSIILRERRTGELQLAATCGQNTENDRSFFITDGYAALARASMETGEAIVIVNATDSAYISPGTAEPLRDRSLLGLPLMVHDQPIGVVIIGRSREQRRFTEDEIDRAKVVTNQAAVAIANARLFREVEQRLVELGTLAEVSRVLFSHLEFPDFHQQVVNELARAFGYPLVAFYQIEGAGLELAAQVGYDSWHLPVYIPLGHGLVGNAAATGQTGYIPDTAAHADHWRTAEGVVSQIALPLRKNGRVLGVLSVESHDPLTEVDLSLLQSLSYQVSTALENARLYTAEQREREIARTLLEIAGDLSGTLRLDEVLNLILERLQIVVPYESAAIGLLAGGLCQVAAAYEQPHARRLGGTHLFPADLPLVARVLRDRTAVIVSDTRQSDDWVVIEGSEDVRSWLGVPLVVQDRTIGLLMLGHVTPAFYSQDAAGLTLAFAQHAALAIDNARLYEQAQVKLREQTFLHEVTTAVASTLDAGQVLRLLAEGVVTILGITSARVAILGNELEIANLVAEHFGAEANEAEKVSAIGKVYEMAAFPVTTATLMAREPLLVVSGNEPEEWLTRMRQRAGKAMLLIPLVARDRVTGFVELWDSRSRRYFTEAETALAQMLINSAAMAIDNARLFADTQRGITEMMLLYDMAVAASSSLELDTILKSVVKTLQFRVFENSVVSVWLLEDTEVALQLRARAGKLETMTSQEQLPAEESLCGMVIQTGKPVLIRDAYQDPRCDNYDPSVRSILCVPLAWGQRVAGILQAISTRENAFSSHDLRLLRTLAGSLAIAIENVRLFSQLKRSEEALRLRNRALERANDRLKELDRLKSAFIASVSHELRTPLNSIIGFSEVLVDGLAGDLGPAAREYLGYIHDSGKHLLDLINDILDLSRIQAGRMTLALEEVDVIAVLEQIRATLAPMVAQKRQTLTIQQKGSLPAIVGDRFRFKQILLNLAGNAIKHTQEDGKIAVEAYLADSNTLRIDVVDNGPGIPLEEQGVIFEEFRQGRTTRPGEGTGLGLAITKRLIELHDGRIWVESKQGAGATFSILMPVVGPEPNDQRQENRGRRV